MCFNYFKVAFENNFCVSNSLEDKKERKSGTIYVPLTSFESLGFQSNIFVKKNFSP